MGIPALTSKEDRRTNACSFARPKMNNSANSRNSGSPLTAASSSSFELGSIPAATTVFSFSPPVDVTAASCGIGSSAPAPTPVDKLENLEKKLDDVNSLLDGALSRIAFLEKELAQSRHKSGTAP